MLRRVIKSCALLLSCVATVAFTQCQNTAPTVAMSDVSMDDWSNPITVEYINADTTLRCDVNLMLHVNRRFQAQNLTWEITTLTPDSLRYSESVSMHVSTEWPAANHTAMDIELPYRRNVHLRHQGSYQFILRPMQRIVGVEAAGINIQTQR